MTYHGGVIMTTANTEAIFWGTSWGSYSGDKITGMDTWYTGFSNSNYAKTSDEYTGSNGQVGPMVNHGGHKIDTSASTSGANTTTILNEVCKVITSPDPTGNGYYAVYADTPRGNAGYCAYHSVGTCKGIRVQFAYFFKLDGDAGCDPATPPASTRRAWLPSPTSADTSSLKLAAIPSIPAPGTTPRAKRTATSAPGPSAPRSSPSPTAPSGRSRASGPTPLTPPAPATPTAPARRAASPASKRLDLSSN